MNDKHINFGIKIAEEAGQKLKKSFKKSRPQKRGTSKEVGSVFDDIVDKIIKEGIEKEFPNHSYLTEESGLIDKGSRFLWIIDPLDGTGNYENHNPFYSVSISLWKDGKPVLGVVEAPSLKERFIGLKGEGAWKINLETGSEEGLELSKIRTLKDSYFVFCEGSEKDKKRITANFEEIYKKTKDFRKIGSAALELAWIASGRAEGYITYRIPIWDIAAGLIILGEAGGNFYDFSGKKRDLNSFNCNEKTNLLATNGKIPIDFNLQ